MATPYALSELEEKVRTLVSDNESDEDDARDIDLHIKTDIAAHAPISALSFVSYVILAYRDGDVISEQTLATGVQHMRGEY